MSRPLDKIINQAVASSLWAIGCAHTEIGDDPDKQLLVTDAVLIAIFGADLRQRQTLPPKGRLLTDEEEAMTLAHWLISTIKQAPLPHIERMVG